MRRLIVAAAVVALAIGAGTVRAQPAVAPAPCGKLLPPTQGVYFGAKPGWHLEQKAYDDIIDTSLIDAFESTGRLLSRRGAGWCSERSPRRGTTACRSRQRRCAPSGTTLVAALDLAGG